MTLLSTILLPGILPDSISFVQYREIFLLFKIILQLQEYPIWYADYETIPQTPYDFTMWQYSERGNVDGIEGNVDLNIWFCPVE